jgi:hypothetical protein
MSKKTPSDPEFSNYPTTANGTLAASSIQSVYEEESFLCGYGSCTPRWLQYFHNAKSLLFMLGTCAFIQSFVVNSIFPVGLSTIERQFHMTRWAFLSKIDINYLARRQGSYLLGMILRLCWPFFLSVIGEILVSSFLTYKIHHF